MEYLYLICLLVAIGMLIWLKIMALADVFDALVSKRCYKDAFSYEKAYEIIENDAGTHFDKQLAMVFLSCKEELERYYNASEK